MKFLMLLTIPICAFLWAYGGAENTSKNWRRIGVPATITVFAYLIALSLKNPLIALFTLVIFPAMWGATTIGYGIPDKNDEGSPLGRFWFRRVKEKNETRFNHSEETANITNLFVRLTVSVIYAFTLIPLVVLGHWLTGATFLIFNTVFWSALVNDLGMYKKLLWQEILIGAGFGLASFLATF